MAPAKVTTFFPLVLLMELAVLLIKESTILVTLNTASLRRFLVTGVDEGLVTQMLEVKRVWLRHAALLEQEALLRAASPREAAGLQDMFLYHALWMIYNSTLAWKWDHDALPACLEDLVNQGYAPAWPLNPFNQWQPMQLSAGPPLPTAFRRQSPGSSVPPYGTSQRGLLLLLLLLLLPCPGQGRTNGFSNAVPGGACWRVIYWC
jgi:hypothetical protein